MLRGVETAVRFSLFAEYLGRRVKRPLPRATSRSLSCKASLFCASTSFRFRFPTTVVRLLLLCVPAGTLLLFAPNRGLLGVPALGFVSWLAWEKATGSTTQEVVMAFCASCGTQMADNAAFCPNCGKAAGQASGAGASAPPPTPAPPASYGSTAAPAAPMAENVAGMLAYFTIIPAIIF